VQRFISHYRQKLQSCKHRAQGKAHYLVWQAIPTDTGTKTARLSAW
jgi:hypothetical protein